MYKIRIIKEAVRDIEKLDNNISRRIAKKINWLAENAGNIESKGLRGNLSGLSKIREGDYRIIYEIIYSEKILVIHFIGHRSEVYKR